MKKKLLCLMIGIILVMSFSSCNKNEEKQGDNNEIEESSNKTNVKENETKDEEVEVITTPKTENPYDGISRIAITYNGDTRTQIGLSWYTPESELFGNDIEIIEKATMKNLDIDYDIDCGQAEYDEDSYYHQTIISGLKPNTEYFYRIGDKASNKWSEYGSFKTAPDSVNEYKFVAVTDTQSAHLPDAYFSTATMEKALEIAKDSAFILHGGDFVDEGDEEYLWLAQMNSAKEILMNNIIVPAVGNHEEEYHAYWQHFKVPHTNDHKTTGTYYSYDYGNVHYVVLDTNKVNDDETSYIDDEQLEWLKDDLEAAKNADFIIVSMHKGLYTAGEHSDNEKFAGEDGARLRVGKVFEDYGVDLVIQGHDHCPSITKPIKQGKVSDDGVIYINTGSAGAKAYEFDETFMPKEYYDLFSDVCKYERPDDTYQNFAIIEVSKDKLTVKMYEMNLLINENNLYILKEFSIDK